MTRLPAKIRVGPADYKVKVIRGLKLDGKKLDGQCRSLTNEILIEAALGPQARMQVAWHEVLHALSFQDDMSGLKLGSERATDRLAWGIMQVLRDNPALRGGK